MAFFIWETFLSGIDLVILNDNGVTITRGSARGASPATFFVPAWAPNPMGSEGRLPDFLVPEVKPLDFEKYNLIPSCTLMAINYPVKTSGGGDQFLVVFQGD